ncbi:MAG TPA: hypothetical protein VFE79_04455, partial [Paraburkholderia sp.]|nr:hypothetical protein [Paraburkholderia sp.]
MPRRKLTRRGPQRWMRRRNEGKALSRQLLARAAFVVAMGAVSARGSGVIELKFFVMLDPRAQTLLKTLIERYIAEGQPV